MSKTGYEKMVSGELYEGPDWDLIEMQVEAKKKLDRLNAVPSWDMANRTAMFRDQLGSFGESFVLTPLPGNTASTSISAKACSSTSSASSLMARKSASATVPPLRRG